MQRDDEKSKAGREHETIDTMQVSLFLSRARSLALARALSRSLSLNTMQVSPPLQFSILSQVASPLRPVGVLTTIGVQQSPVVPCAL